MFVILNWLFRKGRLGRVGELEGWSDRAVMFMHGKIMTIYQVDVDEKMELNLVLAAHRALAVKFWTRVVRRVVRHETALWLSTSLIFRLGLTACTITRVHIIILPRGGHAVLYSPLTRFTQPTSHYNETGSWQRMLRETRLVVRKKIPSVLWDRTRSRSVTKTKARQFRF